MTNAGPYAIRGEHETWAEIVNAAGVRVCDVRGSYQIKLPNTPDCGEMAERIIAALNLVEGMATDQIQNVRPVL
jgi:hypothetical protein